MASKGQMTGMLGVYMTAVELVKRGFIVSPTSRSAAGADLLVTDQKCNKAWSVQVKTNGTMTNFWLVGAHARTLSSPTHMYVFVNVPKNPARTPCFYVVPSAVVAEETVVTPPENASIFYSFYRKDEYQDRWELFGDASGELPEPMAPNKPSRQAKPRAAGPARKLAVQAV